MPEDWVQLYWSSCWRSSGKSSPLATICAFPASFTNPCAPSLAQRGLWHLKGLTWSTQPHLSEWWLLGTSQGPEWCRLWLARRGGGELSARRAWGSRMNSSREGVHLSSWGDFGSSLPAPGTGAAPIRRLLDILSGALPDSLGCCYLVLPFLDLQEFEVQIWTRRLDPFSIPAIGAGTQAWGHPKFPRLVEGGGWGGRESELPQISESEAVSTPGQVPSSLQLRPDLSCTFMRPHYSSAASPLHKRLDNGVGCLTLCL